MGQLIYTAPPLDACIQMQATGGANGCTTNRAYRLYDTTFLEYRLPLRNWSVSVRMGTTFSGQWVPPERLRRESFEGAVREG